MAYLDNYDEYIEVLKEHFKFEKFRDKQLEIIQAIVDNKDVCAIMFTGAGKSLCYQFPAVYTNKITLIISPLISLMDDQKIKLDKLGIPSICLNGSIYNKDNIKSSILNNEYRIVYTTPEYIVGQCQFLKDLEKKNILKMVAVDECHCVSCWGHDFRESYRQLGHIKKWVPNIPVLAVTATATEQVQRDIVDILKLKNPLNIKTTFDRHNLYIETILKNNPKKDLLPLLKNGEPTIIYCQRRKETEKLEKILSENGIYCASYHGGMNSMNREIVHMDFVNNNIQCIIATVAFGMGIDKIIRKVIHYGIPKDLESYYQEIGRAGRDGKKSYCYIFYSPSDFNSSSYFINHTQNQAYRLHRINLLKIMKKYIYLNGCRRKYILSYFGEDYTKESCNMCDNCVIGSTLRKIDFTKEAIILLNVVYETGGYYGISMMIDILRGSNAKKISINFKKLLVYGKGAYHSDKWWKIFAHMLINIDFLKEKSISGGHSFSICRTIKARKWLEKVVEKDTINAKNNCQDKLILSIPKEMAEFYPIQKNDKYNNIKFNLNDIIGSCTINTSKKSTHQITKEMFNDQHMTINQIAKARKCKTRTIEDHIAKLYEDNHNIEVNRLGMDDEKYKLISKTVRDLEYPNKLSLIKNKLPSNVSYLHIKLALAKMNRIVQSSDYLIDNFYHIDTLVNIKYTLDNKTNETDLRYAKLFLYK